MKGYKVMTLIEYKELIETRLDIKDALLIENDVIIPNKDFLSKKRIKDNQWEDLFQFHINKKLYFTNRMKHFVAEITDRKLLTGNYYFEVRV